jgi:hypothetical protein
LIEDYLVWAPVKFYAPYLLAEMFPAMRFWVLLINFGRVKEELP